MKVFLILLLSISALLISYNATLFIGVALFIATTIILIRKYKHDKKFIFIAIIIFLIFVLYGFLDLKTIQSENSIKGLVIKRSDRYFILFDGFERFYVQYEGDNIDVFVLICINGTIQEINFSTIESEFSFQNYLNQSGIFNELCINSYSTIYKSIFNCSLFKNNIISILNNEKSKEIVISLLFNKTIYDTPFESSLSSNSIMHLFSLSGIYLSYFINKTKEFFNRKFSENISILFSFLIVSPILLFNFFSLLVIRIIVYYLVKIIANLIGVKDSLTIRSTSYLILLLNKYNVLQYGFFMPLIISNLFNFSRLLLRRKKWYIKLFLSQLVIFVVLLPVIINFGNAINPISMIFGLFITPIIRLIYIILYPLFFGLKLPFIEIILSWIYDLISFLNFDFLQIYVPQMNQFVIIFYYLIIVFTFYFTEIKFKNISRISLIVLSSLIIFYSLPIRNTFTNQVSFINVGQGDSILIRIRNKTVLVDTGGSLYKDIAKDSLIPYFRKNRIYKIDAVVITHYDMDHYYALDSLKTNFNVGEIYDYNNFSTLNINGISIFNINSNNYSIVDENSKSLVLWFEIGTKKFLLMGDAPVEIEEKILNEYPHLDCDILKVGHHGSDTSSSEKFLKAVSPEEAVISCGVNNKYGHPDKEVIKDLNDLKIKIRRTDIEGTIDYIL